MNTYQKKKAVRAIGEKVTAATKPKVEKKYVPFSEEYHRKQRGAAGKAAGTQQAREWNESRTVTPNKPGKGRLRALPRKSRAAY